MHDENLESNWAFLAGLSAMVRLLSKDVATVRQRLTKPSVTAANAGELAALASVEERLRFIERHLTEGGNHGSGQDQVGRQTENSEELARGRQEPSRGDTLPGGERYDTYRQLSKARKASAAAYLRGKRSKAKRRKRRR